MAASVLPITPNANARSARASAGASGRFDVTSIKTFGTLTSAAMRQHQRQAKIDTHALRIGMSLQRLPINRLRLGMMTLQIQSGTQAGRGRRIVGLHCQHLVVNRNGLIQMAFADLHARQPDFGSDFLGRTFFGLQVNQPCALHIAGSVGDVA